MSVAIVGVKVTAPKTNAANERLAQHLWNHRDDLFTFLRQPGLDATNWRAELAIRFGVILRKVWGGSRTWAGARAQAVGFVQECRAIVRMVETASPEQREFVAGEVACVLHVSPHTALGRVSTEMSLHVLAYNLKRVMKILGSGALIEAIRA